VAASHHDLKNAANGEIKSSLREIAAAFGRSSPASIMRYRREVRIGNIRVNLLTV
jgi:hypothetical protein